MLLALLEDAARVPGWTVCTTWDARLGEFPLSGVDVRIVDEPREEASIFAELCATAGAVYVIAPELDDQLATRCRAVLRSEARLLNSSVTALADCSDKLATFERLWSGGVPTIPTRLVAPDCDAAEELPVVVKPRFGAGSHETHLVTDVTTLREIAKKSHSATAVSQFIEQPFVAGRTLSGAVVVRDGEPVEIWPVAEQHLSSEGRFRYLGGLIPARNVTARRIAALAEQAVHAFPGLRGYVGLDVIVPDCRPDEPLIVEVNPRLTTSYLGYRALARCNLAPLVMLAEEHNEHAGWRETCVELDSAGRITNR